jgi:putative radical SAM enzyme (TIGR03279 family)
MLKISKVIKNQIGSEIGLKKGDEILAFNGFLAEDILDYFYYDGQEFFTLTANTRDGEVDFEIEKDFDESLGLEFLSDGLEIKNCRNSCIFCFVDQMPKGMRPSLYVKDDDYRQSFLRGNFVTLTNVTDREIDRIIRLQLSPIYVSVQVTDSEIRKKMLGNRFAGDILEKLKKLTENGILVHTQVVLVPSVNDGAVLDNTCHDLVALGDNICSIAIVPCGITKFRENLYKIEDISSGYARCVIEQVKNLSSLLKTDKITLADEFYLRAKLPLPSEDSYNGYPQIENGVGLTTKFLSELKCSVKKSDKKGKYLVVTGISASSIIAEQIEFLKGYISGLDGKVLPVENEFFGSTVNCTGLLVGKDVLNAVKKESGYEYLVLPSVCLKQGENVFLDGVTLKEIAKETGLKIIITDGTGESFFHAFSGGSNVRIIK